MLKNYLKTALRNLWKNRFYSGINLLGLSSGMLCFLFIAAFIQDELSYDRFHEKGERIVRMNFIGKMGENDLTVPQLGAPVGAVMQEEFPEIENFMRFRETGEFLVSYENQSFQESEVVYADSTLLEIFNFALIAGDPNSILRQAGTAIVTQSIAKKYFGDQNPIGKTIRLDNESDYVINGVLADLPKNSTIQQDIFLAMAGLDESRQPMWTNMNFETYFLLREGANIANIEAKLPEFLRRHLGSEMERFLKISFEDFIAAGNSGEFTLLPLYDIYLHSEFPENLGPSSDIKYLYIFGAVGLFILLLAAINFINLATARASTRSREVGVRKVVGAGRAQLMGQFLSESTLLAFIALGVALIGMRIALPFFNELAGKSISMSFFTEQPLMILIGFSLVAIIGLLAGAYPSFVLAGFRPIEAIQQRVQGNGKRRNQLDLRGTLVVFQFAITTLLLVGTLTVYRQMQFVQEKKLGYNKEQLLLIDGAYGLGDQLSAFTSQLEMDARVKNLATTSYLPTPSSRNKSGYFLGNSPEKSALYMMQVWYVDDNYLPTMDIELVDGRNFAPTTETGTTTNVIVNEAAIREFQLTGDVIGQQISRNFGDDAGDQSALHVYNIVGVVKDFHYESFHHKIDPLVMHQGQSSRFIAARVTPTNLPGLLTDIEQQWKTLAPHQPFQYTFLDEGFAQMYEAEIRMSKVARLFAFLSILIASIGLLGLATFTALQRQKEVSIRKVLGASVSGLFLLLTRDFGKLILIALVISLPISWYLMQQWLQGFVYATAISIGTFFLTGGVLLVVALLAVGFQSLRTALGNPVDSLRGT